MTPRIIPPAPKLLLLSLAAIVGSTAGQAIAQEDTAELERIQVTGTQIDRVDIEGTSPIVSFSREDIENSGVTTIQELLRKLPSAGPGTFNTLNDSQDDTSSGTAAISLRGLGASSTLTLVNGRRAVQSATAQGITTNFTDLNSIPLAAIERIDILKDGASPVYGTDAIAGVVNIILRNDYEGFEFTVGTGTSGESDADEDVFQAVWGNAHDDGHVMVALNYLKRDKLINNDRDFARSADFSDRGGIDFRSSSGNPGSYAPEGQGFRPDPSCPPERNDGTFCRYDFGPFLSMQPAAERTGLYVHVDQDVTDNITGFADFQIQRNSSFLSASPSPAFTVLGGFRIPENHPNNPFPGEGDLANVRRRLTEFGPRQDDTDSTFFNTVLGFQGQLNLADRYWNWEASYQYGMNEVNEVGLNGYINSREMQAAFEDGSFNPFGCLAGPECQGSGLDPESIEDVLDNAGNPDVPDDIANRLGTQTHRLAKSHMKVYNLKANGDLFELPAGPAVASVGLERRETDIKDIPDDQYLRGEIVGTESTFVLGNREVDAAFGELILPVTDWVEIQSAIRWEDYSDFGSTTNPKIGVLVKPNDDLRIRGTWSESFRAPSLAELGNISDESPNLVDPIRCPVTGDAIDCGEQETIVRFLPTEGLEPEESESINLGAAWQATENFSTSFDWWQIEVDNLIGTDNQFLLDQNADNPNVVVRFPATAEDQELGIPGRIRFVRGQRVNFGKEEVEGFDVNFNWGFDTDYGRFGWDTQWTRFLTHDRQTAPGTDPTDLVGKFDAAVGLGRPEDKVTSALNWLGGDFGAYLRVNHESGFDDDPTFVQREVDSWTTVDASVRYMGLPNSTISLSVQNMFDEEPPFVAASATGFSTQHNPVGQFWMVRFNYRM